MEKTRQKLYSVAISIAICMVGISTISSWTVSGTTTTITQVEVELGSWDAILETTSDDGVKVRDAKYEDEEQINEIIPPFFWVNPIGATGQRYEFLDDYLADFDEDDTKGIQLDDTSDTSTFEAYYCDYAIDIGNAEDLKIRLWYRFTSTETRHGYLSTYDEIISGSEADYIQIAWRAETRPDGNGGDYYREKKDGNWADRDDEKAGWDNDCTEAAVRDHDDADKRIHMTSYYGQLDPATYPWYYWCLRDHGNEREQVPGAYYQDEDIHDETINWWGVITGDSSAPNIGITFNVYYNYNT